MKKNLLKIESIHNFLFNIVGGQGIEMIQILLKKGTIDEFSLAEKLDIQVNVTRSLLYKLYSHKIVSFTKERDEKKGWWIYSWSIYPKRIFELLTKSLQVEMEQLNEKTQKRKVVQLYRCPVCEISLPFSEAMENSFQCPSCAGMLEFLDQKVLVSKWQNRVKDLKKDLKELKEIE